MRYVYKGSGKEDKSRDPPAEPEPTKEELLSQKLEFQGTKDRVAILKYIITLEILQVYIYNNKTYYIVCFVIFYTLMYTFQICLNLYITITL